MLGLALVAVTAQADRPGELLVLLWTDPGHAREVLLEQPATCNDQASQNAPTRIGEALFNSPATLGGQAERAGLSCAGCHANGRRNQWFRLDGVSAEPGSADVSSSFFSIKRANGHFDPKPIPDLALPGKVSRDPSSHQLENFLRGLIVEEFSGQEPGDYALSALASYVRTIKVCPDRATERRSIGMDLRLTDSGIEGAIDLLSLGDLAGSVKLIKGTRFRLGLISERLAGAGQAGLRGKLLTASRELAAIQTEPTAAALEAWQSKFDRKLWPALIKAEAQSLYAPARVDAWLRTRKSQP